MKKSARFICELLMTMTLIMTFSDMVVFATPPKETAPPEESYLPGVNNSEIKSNYEEAGIPTPSGSDSDELIRAIIGNGLQYTKVIIVVVGILYITIVGYKLVTASSNEEELTNAKKAMIYIIIAFLLLSMSQEIAKIFDFRKTTLLDSPDSILRRVKLFDDQVKISITFIKYILASYAGVMVVRSSIKLITSGGNEEETSKHKHSILYSAAGLVLVYVGDIFINKVFYVIDKTKYTSIKGLEYGVSVDEGIQQIVGVTNFLVTFVAPVAFLLLLVAAIMYIASGGKEENMEKAKRLIITVLVGVAIIYGAFAIVSTIVAGKLPDGNKASSSAMLTTV